MANNEGPIRLTPSIISNSPNLDVRESSFFREWDELPSPEDVQAQAEAQCLAGFNPNPRRDYKSAVPHFIKPQAAVFADMNLLVKWGRTEHISEAQTLFALRRLLNDLVPVPEVYGWRTDGDVSTFTWNTSEDRHWSRHGINWRPTIRSRSPTSCAQYVTICVALSRTLRIRSWVCIRALQHVCASPNSFRQGILYQFLFMIELWAWIVYQQRDHSRL
jgi:hypothetical protein